MKIRVINGPNINMLGIREVNIYGSENYETLIESIKDKCLKEGIEVECFQSNHEGRLIDYIHLPVSQLLGNGILLLGHLSFETIQYFELKKRFNL